MKKSDIEKNIAEAEADRAAGLQELGEIADRVAYLANERKALSYPLKNGDATATQRAKAIDAELGHLRKKQAELSQEVEEIERMLLAWNDDLHTAVIEEAQIAYDHAALKAVEGWIKYFELQREVQETADEIDRWKKEAIDAENTLRGMVGKDYSTGPSFDPPLSEMPKRLADLHHRRVLLMTRLGIG